MKIAFFSVEKGKQAPFVGAFPESEIVFIEETLNEDTARKGSDADIACLFVDSSVSKSVIDAMPNLKFIATRSTGYNHIDVEYAKSKGIPVANVPAYGSYTVAEFSFGLLLNLSRKIIEASNYVKNSMDFHYNNSMEGFDLQGKTLGVVGTGRIGKNMVKIAKGFGMKIIACDLYPDLDFAKEYGFEYKTLDQVLEESDIVSLHTPYSIDNHHILARENISRMKRGAYVVNTARGELIDTEALVWGLKEGIIAGAGLDVLEEEKSLKKGEATKICDLNRELMKMPNVIITPHSAFFTVEAVDEISKVTVENIKSFLAGKPENLV
ncbi:MAG: NAD(P)-dependent oxidoreductase [Candidatus Paceibacterota bacterium]|jgi:D-lactate dehydrogenase